ncbi:MULTISPECIES: hypothetical protein [Lysobacter]|uniref:GIY-YIG nuclease family protein n=1 Tax=Lysobacter firmicutimachus TaxID=1792846 RepID=A0ABU8D0I1_9GAMM|nr:hypothetical protein [Lysobacter antibioticus]
MALYQILVEGVFVTSPELGKDVGGFHTTFYVKANGAANAVHRVGDPLAERMLRHQVLARQAKLLKAYFWVDDLWEVSEEKFLQNEGRDSGFTFFRIGLLERVHLALRREHFKIAKPWLLIDG